MKNQLEKAAINDFKLKSTQEKSGYKKEGGGRKGDDERDENKTRLMRISELKRN